MHTRAARSGDRSAIEAVTLAAYEQYASLMPAHWEGYRRNILVTLAAAQPEAQMVVEEKGRVVGAVLLYPAGSVMARPGGEPITLAEPEVRLLAVAPAARGRGIGAALMDGCIRRARRSGAGALTLHTTDIMQAAMRLYERLGFRRAPELDIQPAPGVTIKGYRLGLDVAASSALLVLGPSGAGKSTVGTWLMEDLDLLHLEIDQSAPVDGVELAGIRTEWSLFLRQRKADPLAGRLAMQAARLGRAGAVLTLPSNLLLPVPWLESAHAAGIHAVVLYGSRPECLDAFLSREAATGRGLDVEHWLKNNESYHAAYGRPEYSGWRLATFESGVRRPRAAIAAEISKRLAG